MTTRLVVLRGDTATDAELIGLAEAAVIVRVSESRLHELYSRRLPKVQPFPEPIARARLGPLWDRRDVVAWVDERDRRRQADEEERERRRREAEVRLADEPVSPLERAALDLDQADWRAELQAIMRQGLPKR